MEEKINENVEVKKTEKESKAWVVVAIIAALAFAVVGFVGINVYNKAREEGIINQYNEVQEENIICDEECENELNPTAFPTMNKPTMYKPIIYLYPEETIDVSVKLGKPENLTCTYPKYVDGWNVAAEPDGNLVDQKTGRNLYALYWEGIHSRDNEMSEGFVVKGEDSIAFLEEKLEILGLTEHEAEEFIVYWLPKLEANKYNYIRFASMEEINENMPLEIEPKPDNIIRVLMEFKGLDEPIEVQEQVLETPQRNGFTVIEWGGTILGE